MDAIINTFLKGLDLFGALTISLRYYLWIGFGILGLLSWAYWGHRLMRHLMGHRQFRGTWYNPMQFQELVNILAEDQERGHRVMRHDEIELLREWRYGFVKSIGMDRKNIHE